MPKPPERFVPQQIINQILQNEQPKGDDVPIIDGNAPEAGGTAIGTMTLTEILDVLKRDRNPKEALSTRLITEIEGRIFSKNSFNLPIPGEPLLVIEDARKGRQMVVIKEDQQGLQKRDVRKLPAQADPNDVPHISVEEAMVLFDQETVRGGLPTEDTLEKIARLTHETTKWKSKKRSSQGGWSSDTERKRVKKRRY